MKINSLLDGMEKRRVIRVLTVYSVGNYYLDGIEEQGLVAEAMQMFEDFINDRMERGHLRVHIAITALARDQLIPALLAGRGDLIVAGLSITPERQEQIDFSHAVNKPMSQILITGPNAPPLDTLESLAGHAIHLRASSSYRSGVEALNQRLKAKKLAPIEVLPISELLEDQDLIEMVNTGLLPWAITGSDRIALWQGLFDDITVREDLVFKSDNRHAWAMRKQSPQLKAAVNLFLKDHREGTLLGNILRNRYLRDANLAAQALSDDNMARLNQLEKYFQLYGAQYQIDHLLAAAQGYQESRLDQSKVSEAGAVGIMQLLPSTAADPNVGIGDIANEESNIHAGIKYLAFLRQRYFSDDGISKLNQTLLALAAYNLGPARVTMLRNTADAEGYDPDRWFDNVEIIAAREVGREPVQYVANIFKYYQSYRLALQHQSRHQAAREDAGIE